MKIIQHAAQVADAVFILFHFQIYSSTAMQSSANCVCEILKHQNPVCGVGMREPPRLHRDPVGDTGSSGTTNNI